MGWGAGAALRCGAWAVVAGWCGGRGGGRLGLGRWCQGGVVMAALTALMRRLYSAIFVPRSAPNWPGFQAQKFSDLIGRSTDFHHPWNGGVAAPRASLSDGPSNPAQIVHPQAVRKEQVIQRK
ncbi:hypothetical protein C8F04DRAFT_1191258 [Mycena alexandri]|uniref:Uncharacterized protein n=1 Tax=Mycena alexandri TaxID=1745969 RepID=A0AAD6SDL2_9AGAR|nr:hypothetical protein C8F04DRAFT_1191258 [Mycena alexandri]